MRREKALSFSGCESRPATVAPAGSNRSSDGGNEVAEAFDVKGPSRDSANVQAVTRVNVEQASKTVMRMPTQSAAWGRLASVGKRAKRAPTGSAGVLTMACMERGRQEQHGKPRHVAERSANRRCVSSRAGRDGVAEGRVVPGKPGNAGGGKAPWFKSDAAKRRGIGDWATW